MCLKRSVKDIGERIVNWNKALASLTAQQPAHAEQQEASLDQESQSRITDATTSREVSGCTTQKPRDDKYMKSSDTHQVSFHCCGHCCRRDAWASAQSDKTRSEYLHRRKCATSDSEREVVGR